MRSWDTYGNSLEGVFDRLKSAAFDRIKDLELVVKNLSREMELIKRHQIWLKYFEIAKHSGCSDSLAEQYADKRMSVDMDRLEKLK